MIYRRLIIHILHLVGIVAFWITILLEGALAIRFHRGLGHREYLTGQRHCVSPGVWNPRTYFDCRHIAGVIVRGKHVHKVQSVDNQVCVLAPVLYGPLKYLWGLL